MQEAASPALSILPSVLQPLTPGREHTHKRVCSTFIHSPPPPLYSQASSCSALALAPQQPPASNVAGELQLGRGQSTSLRGPGTKSLAHGRTDVPVQHCNSPSQRLERGRAEESPKMRVMEAWDFLGVAESKGICGHPRACVEHPSSCWAGLGEPRVGGK